MRNVRHPSPLYGYRDWTPSRINAQWSLSACKTERRIHDGDDLCLDGVYLMVSADVQWTPISVIRVESEAERRGY